MIPRFLPAFRLSRRQWLLKAGSAGLLWLTLSGCSNTPPGSSAPTANSDTKAGSSAGHKITLAGIASQDDQFFKMVQAGMQAEAQKQGASIELGSSGGAQDKEISLVETYAAKKVDALLVAPLSAKASIPALQRASEGGCKIVVYDSPLEADFPVGSIKSDARSLGSETGKAARKYIQEKLGGKAKIAVITYMSLYPEPASQRTNGFLDEVKQLPGVQIVAQQDAWLAPNAVTVVESILSAHPDLNMVWAANEGGTVGAVTAVKNAGKAGKIVVFGTDISAQMADFLLAGDNILQAVTGQKPFDIGAQAVDTAIKAVKGEKVEKAVLLPGVLFTREKPDEVQKIKADLGQLSK